MNNGVEAEKYYKDKNVIISGDVNMIYDFGTVILVSDDMQPFSVNFSSSSRESLAAIKKGQSITVICGTVDSLQIANCSLMNSQKK